MIYYGYKKRENAQQVDWGKLGSDMAKNLKTEADARIDREEKRTQDYYNTIKSFEEQELGQNKSLNNIVMEGADNFRNIAIERDRLMRAGVIKPSDVKMFNQTARDDFKTLNRVAKSYQAEYAKAQQEMASGNASAFTTWNNMQKDEFGNLADKTIYVNPETGKVYIAKIGKDGKVSTKPGDLLDINSINSRLKDRYDKIDVAADVNKYVKNFQDYITASGLTSINDIKQNPEYEKARAGIIAAMLTDDRATMSVLSDNAGEYDFTTDPKEAKGNPNMILMVPDANGVLQPQITPEQRKVAEDYIEAQIESQLKLEEEIDQPRAAGRSGGSGSGGGDDEENYDIYYRAAIGDGVAIKALSSRSKNIKNITIVNGKIEIELDTEKGVKTITADSALDAGELLMGIDGMTSSQINVYRKKNSGKTGVIPAAAGTYVPAKARQVKTATDVKALSDAVFPDGSNKMASANDMTLNLNQVIEQIPSEGGKFGSYSDRVRFVTVKRNDVDKVRIEYLDERDGRWHSINGTRFYSPETTVSNKANIQNFLKSDVNKALTLAKKSYDISIGASTTPTPTPTPTSNSNTPGSGGNPR